MIQIIRQNGVTQMKHPTIWEALSAKLGRAPTNAECRTEILRILEDARRERAEQGKLPHQRKR